MNATTIPSTTTTTFPAPPGTPRVGLIFRTSKATGATIRRAVVAVDLPPGAIRLFVLDDARVAPRGFTTPKGLPVSFSLHGQVPADDEGLHAFVSAQFSEEADHFYLADIAGIATMPGLDADAGADADRDWIPGGARTP